MAPESPFRVVSLEHLIDVSRFVTHRKSCS